MNIQNNNRQRYKLQNNNREIQRYKYLYKQIISKPPNYIFFYKLIILVLIILITIYLNLKTERTKYIKYLIILLIIIILLIDTLLVEEFTNNIYNEQLYLNKITHFNTNLNKEVIQNNNLKNKIKHVILEIKQLNDNTDLINVLIYLVIISLIANVVYVDLNIEYTKVLVLLIIMFLVGVFVYLFRYNIKVRSNPRKKYF